MTCARPEAALSPGPLTLPGGPSQGLSMGVVPGAQGTIPAPRVPSATAPSRFLKEGVGHGLTAASRPPDGPHLRTWWCGGPGVAWSRWGASPL